MTGLVLSVLFAVGFQAVVAEDTAKDGPALRGVVRFAGPTPERKSIQLTERGGTASECAKLHETPPQLEDVLVSEKGELANVFVYLKKGLEKRRKYPVPEKPAVLDQKGCMFRPHVQGVRVGQTLQLRNSDALLHNVRSHNRRNRAFNIGQPAGSGIRKKVFRRPEMAVKVQCDIHNWMTAYLHILEHPFFAVTAQDGKFTITGLPAGDYTLAAWHETYGEQEAKVTVRTAGTSAVNFTFKPKARHVRAQPFDEIKLKNWHQWRGPDANGVSTTATPPAQWGEGKNIRWKVAIEGRGSSTPIVWEDKVFLLTAINTGKIDASLPRPEDQPKRVFGIKHPNTSYDFVVLCLDRATGKVLWRRTATHRVPHEGHHGDNDFASASPTTDGERLYCWFGSAGLFCYDLSGKKLWDRDLGQAFMGASLGEGCSPVIHDGKLVIVRDQQRQSYIEVLDAKTGKTRWRADRDEPNAWATPVIVNRRGTTQVITSASNMVRSYDLNDGRIVWRCGGLTGNVIPSPVVEGDVVYCMSGYQGSALYALTLSGIGDVSNSDAIIWSKRRGTPYVPSPLLYDGFLYFTQSNQAILSCVDAKTGATIMERTRLPGLARIYSSPVGADGRFYITGRDGTTLVLQRSSELRVLAKNQLDESVVGSPALAGSELFLRGSKSLYCIAPGG